METTVIPTGASAVVTADDRHRYDHRDHHPDRWDLSTEMQRNFADVGAGFTAGALAASKTDQIIDQRTAHLSERMGDGFGASNTQIAATTTALGVQVAATTSALGLQAQTLAGQQSVQAQNFFSLSNVQATDIGNRASVERNALSFQAQLAAQTNQSALILQGQQLAAAAAAKAAECCCELRTAIIADGQKTRDLILSEKALDERFKALALANAYNVLAGRVTPVAPPIT